MAKIYVQEKDKERITKMISSFDLDYSLERDFVENQNLKGFIYVPSINLYVSKEKKFHGKNWFETHEFLQREGEKMPTPYEFLEFLKYVKTNEKNIYNKITQVKLPWRAEWLDAGFKRKNGDLYINYHIFDDKGKIVEKSEILDKNTLMKDETSQISLGNFVENSHTSQGFPSKSVKKGDLYYSAPEKDNDSVVEFGAYDGWSILNCNRDPLYRYFVLGVRAVRRE